MSTTNGCRGSYIFIQFDTLFYDPLLSQKVDRRMLEAKGDAASWYDVECDAAGRPAIFTRYLFGKKDSLTVDEYDGQSNHVARQIVKNPQGDILETNVIERDARERPARIVVLGADGKTEKIGLFEYNENVLDLNVECEDGNTTSCLSQKIHGLAYIAGGCFLQSDENSSQFTIPTCAMVDGFEIIRVREGGEQ